MAAASSKKLQYILLQFSVTIVNRFQLVDQKFKKSIYFRFVQFLKVNSSNQTQKMGNQANMGCFRSQIAQNRRPRQQKMSRSQQLSHCNSEPILKVIPKLARQDYNKPNRQFTVNKAVDLSYNGDNFDSFSDPRKPAVNNRNNFSSDKIMKMNSTSSIRTCYTAGSAEQSISRQGEKYSHDYFNGMKLEKSQTLNKQDLKNIQRREKQFLGKSATLARKSSEEATEFSMTDLELPEQSVIYDQEDYHNCQKEVFPSGEYGINQARGQGTMQNGYRIQENYGLNYQQPRSFRLQSQQKTLAKCKSVPASNFGVLDFTEKRESQAQNSYGDNCVKITTPYGSTRDGSKNSTTPVSHERQTQRNFKPVQSPYQLCQPQRQVQQRQYNKNYARRDRQARGNENNGKMDYY